MKPAVHLATWRSLGACAISAVGCRSVGPDYQGPPRNAVLNTPAAHGPFVSSSDPAFSGERAPGQWWRLYDSPQLDELVSAALLANTDLRMAQANLERSVALLQQARAARQPPAAVNFDPSYQQLSSEGYLHSGTVPPTGLYDTGVSVRYELDVFGRLKRAIEAAAADDEAVRAAFDLTKITVAAETARAYADVCNAGEELQVTPRSLQLQVQSTDTTRRLVEAGRTFRAEITRSFLHAGPGPG